MHLEILSSISQIDASRWNSLFAADYPFCRHEFLLALEQGQSVGFGSGWQPQHLLLWDGATLLAAAPAYLKQHSYGEYLFDRVFAQAYQRYSLPYYPKLLLAVPFTPAEGPRIGMAAGVDPALILPLLQQCIAVGVVDDAIEAAITDPTKKPPAPQRTVALKDLSHWQCLYPGKMEQQLFRAAGWLERFDVQFEWQNQLYPPQVAIAQRDPQQQTSELNVNPCAATHSSSEQHHFNQSNSAQPVLTQRYQSFAQFLSTLTARKRKQIRKERNVVQQHGIQLRTLTGAALDSAFWQQFYAFYVATYLKRSGHQGYLTAKTFALWGEQLAAQIVVFSAWHADEMVAASLCFRANDKLYGRYWGCSEAYAMLHFECCYYSGIEYCIEQGIAAFDAGAQGEHKLQRGFSPVIRSGFYRFAPAPAAPETAPSSANTTSRQPSDNAAAANLRHSMQQAIANYCLEEQTMVLKYQQQALAALPFAKAMKNQAP